MKEPALDPYGSKSLLPRTGVSDLTGQAPQVDDLTPVVTPRMDRSPSPMPTPSIVQPMINTEVQPIQQQWAMHSGWWHQGSWANSNWGSRWGTGSWNWNSSTYAAPAAGQSTSDQPLEANWPRSGAAIPWTSLPNQTTVPSQGNPCGIGSHEPTGGTCHQQHPGGFGPPSRNPNGNGNSPGGNNPPSGGNPPGGLPTRRKPRRNPTLRRRSPPTEIRGATRQTVMDLRGDIARLTTDTPADPTDHLVEDHQTEDHQVVQGDTMTLMKEGAF